MAQFLERPRLTRGTGPAMHHFRLRKLVWLLVCATVLPGWTVRTGNDRNSGTKFSIAQQNATGSDAAFAFECQDSKDMMVGIQFNGTDGKLSSYSKGDFRFQAGSAAPVKATMKKEESDRGTMVYTLRISDSPTAGSVLPYLMSQPGDLLITTPFGTKLVFPDDGREQAIIAALEQCGVTIKRKGGR